LSLTVEKVGMIKVVKMESLEWLRLMVENVGMVDVVELG